MSLPTAKRKVMGRIDLSDGQNTSSSGPAVQGRTATAISSARLNAPTSHTPPLTSSGAARKAKVNPASIVTSGADHGKAGVRSPFNANTHTVRSPPLNGPSIGEYAINSHPTPFFPTVRGVSTAPVSRHATRSPSPTRMYGASSSVLRPGPGPSVDARSISPGGLNVARAKTRPASQIFTHQDGLRAGLSAIKSPRSGTSTPITAKAAASSTTDSLSRGGHVRAQSAYHSADHSRPSVQSAGVASPYQPRSRSPSPTFIRNSGREGRKMSHGSSASLGGASSLSSNPATDAVARQATTSTGPSQRAHKRPSLSSLHAVSSTGRFSEHSLTSAGLESPLDLHSPTLAERPAPFTNGSFTSPPPYATTSSAAPAMASPTVELGAEAVEAKTNRKILDLEITNKSLLAINGGLEVVKLKQAREIRDLKRRIRDGRGGLGDRLGLQSTAADGETLRGGDSGSASEEDEEEEEEEDDEDTPLNAELEEAHRRCRTLIDAMVLQARHAILSTYEHEREDEQRPVGNRVLHPTEVDELLQAKEQHASNSGTDDEQEQDLTQRLHQPFPVEENRTPSEGTQELDKTKI